MNRFFNFKSLTLLITIISVVVPVWIWRADLGSRSLQVRIVSQVSLQPDNAGSISGLQVAVDGVPLKSPYLSVLELSNNGDKPIPSVDFEAPLEIRLADGSTVARAQVTETKPKDIEAILSSDSDAQILKVKPLLLNPKDVITISVLTSGKKPEFSARARISGISAVQINEDTGKFTRLHKGALYFVAALLLFVTSNITSASLTSTESVLLTKRAAILVSMTTGIIGGALFMVVLETFRVTDISLIVLAFVATLFPAFVISVYLNWNAKPLNHK